MSDHPQITPSDCVLYKDADGNVMSCGYTIDSELLRQGISPIRVTAEGKQKGKVSDLFADLAIPMGLVCVGDECENRYASASTLDSDLIDNSLYDKLVELAAAHSDRVPPTISKSKTQRKKVKASLNKTRHSRKD